MFQDFGLAQIFPLADEDAVKAPKVVSVSFSDPFVLITRNDGSVAVLSADETGDIDEVEQGPAVAQPKWTSGSLFEDNNDVFCLEYGDEEEASNVLLFLLSQSGGLHVSNFN